MPHFYDHDDRAHLATIRREATPEYDAYIGLNQAVFGREGALTRRERELIATAVAITAQCPFCIQSHTRNAVAAGVTAAELSEAAMVAVAIGAGAAITHGAMAMKLYDDATHAAP